MQLPNVDPGGACHLSRCPRRAEPPTVRYSSTFSSIRGLLESTDGRFLLRVLRPAQRSPRVPRRSRQLCSHVLASSGKPCDAVRSPGPPATHKPATDVPCSYSGSLACPSPGDIPLAAAVASYDLKHTNVMAPGHSTSPRPAFRLPDPQRWGSPVPGRLRLPTFPDLSRSPGTTTSPRVRSVTLCVPRFPTVYSLRSIPARTRFRFISLHLRSQMRVKAFFRRRPCAERLLPRASSSTNPVLVR
jgi:hypothetical protein